MFNRKWIACAALLGTAAILVAQGVVRLEARMANGAASGKAKYKLSTRAGRQIQEELEFEAEDLMPNTEYTMTVGGLPVGTAMTNGFGAFAWSKRTLRNPRYSVSVGTPVTVENLDGVALSGAFAAR